MRLSRPPPLRNLRAFCAAARHRSFKAAADELFLTPSAVSHQMKELEEALGVRLFERKTRALELTTVGHTLLEEVEPLLEALERSLAQIARRSGRQTLRVLLPSLPRVIVPVLSRSNTSTSPAASTARPLVAITLRRMSRSMPLMPIALNSPPMVVGIKQTSSAVSTGTENAAPE